MFESIRSRFDLLTSLLGGGAYIETVKVVIDIVGQLQQTDNRSEQIKLGLQILKELATLTDTQADDQIVAVVDRALSPQVIDILVRIVGAMLGDSTPQSVEDSMEDLVTVQAFGISLPMLFQLATTLAAIIRTIRKS